MIETRKRKRVQRSEKYNEEEVYERVFTRKTEQDYGRKRGENWYR